MAACGRASKPRSSARAPAALLEVEVVGMCSVVLRAEDDIEEPRGEGRYRLVLTNDGSSAALAVVRQMNAVLAQVRPEVVLLRGHQVLDAGTLFPELDAVAREFPHGVSVTPRIESLEGEKTAARLILDVAKDVGANAIAMSTHGHSARRHLFAGSVTMAVLGSSPVPVIVARAV